MSIENRSIANAYLVKGVIGNTAALGTPIVQFALVVTPGNREVSGGIHIYNGKQGDTYTGKVTGALHAAGLGNYTQVVALNGSICPDGPMPPVLPFQAHMALDVHWQGIGGFHYAGVHVDDVPVRELAAPSATR